MESLLDNSIQTAGEDHGNKLWRTIPLLPIYTYQFVLVSYEQHLLAVCREGSTYVYSPNMQSWVLFMDKNHLSCYPCCAVLFRDQILSNVGHSLYHLKATGIIASI